MEVRNDPTGLRRLVVQAPEFDAELEVFGDSPEQAIGTVLGCDIYFRVRHDRWSVEVADHDGRMPSDGKSNVDGFCREAEFPNASWMPHGKAVRIIARCLFGVLG